MNKEDRIAGLESQIKQLQHQVCVAQCWEGSVRSLDSFSPEEKTEVFDRLYDRARRYLQTFAETGREPKDGKHYLYEAVMSNMLGKSVWSVIRSLQG